MSKAITIQTPPSTIGQPQVALRKGDFEAAIYQKGYTVHIEKAVLCPCRSRQAGNQALSTCKNCAGVGWVFINKTETRLLMHSMNMSTKYKDWTEENMGTVAVTAGESDRLSYMDRITLLDAISVSNQILHPKKINGFLRATLAYDVKEIEEAFMFLSADEPLKRLERVTDYEVLKNKIIFSQAITDYYDTLGYDERGEKIEVTIVLKYAHSPQFHVIDLVRETITVLNTNDKGKEEAQQMPINAVARRTNHFRIDESPFNEELFDNSYKNC